MGKRKRTQRSYETGDCDGQGPRKIRVLNDRSDSLNLPSYVPIMEPATVQVISESEQKQPSSQNKESRVQRIIESLSENYQPECLVGRESEQLQILDFVETGAKKGGSHIPLVICGPPGTGKSLTVKDSLKRLHSKIVFEELEVNMMRLKNDWDIYTVILKKLYVSRAHLFKKSSQEILEHLFTTGKFPFCQKIVLRQPLVLILQEIDSCSHKSNKQLQIIYNLLEWSLKPHAKLVLLFLSNRSDFSTVLSRRIESRLGNNQIIFKPYTDQFMMKIIEHRLGVDQWLFTKTAVQFAVKKIAVKTTDIRSLLKLFRSTLECFLRSTQKFVTIDHVKESHNRLYANPVVVAVTNLNPISKKVLLTIIKYFTESEKCWVGNLLENTLLKHFVANSAAIHKTLSLLKDLGLIKMQKKIHKSCLQSQILLQCEKQDVMEALECDTNLKIFFQSIQN